MRIAGREFFEIVFMECQHLTLFEGHNFEFGRFAREEALWRSDVAVHLIDMKSDDKLFSFVVEVGVHKAAFGNEVSVLANFRITQEIFAFRNIDYPHALLQVGE